MIDLDEAISAIRFGYGLHPAQSAPATPEGLLAELSGPDPALPAPAPDLDQRLALRVEIYSLRRERRKAKDEKKVDAISRKLKELNNDLGDLTDADAKRLFSNAVHAPAPFRERLVHFWTDHFTVAANNRIIETGVQEMIDSRIRPNVNGNFRDMLIGVTQHPEMLIYLNQANAAGPNSPAGKSRKRGLNENLAREIMELHTLGVGGPYTQADVREFAELLTGLASGRDGFTFNARMAEPGAEQVLGKRYGSDKPAKLRDVEQALGDLALHPQTATHLASKLLVHFIGAPADPELVERMARAYLDADGALVPMYRVMLEDERSWRLPLQKAKTPFEFIVSALRAMDGIVPDVAQARAKDVRRTLRLPMERMGQPLLRPNGPDGWGEAPETWITPSGLAERIDWISELTQGYARDVDPRAFIEQTLGPVASPLLERAVAGSETRHEGVALVLASPEFNRR
ncbi:DUF1800 domain-containing protein [Oceanibium sediminis]|uniref:DUF1800 domain-containing protein n=1 Tax=Oceanibium sediminis TaxID=2026339 RepID=UPI000DD35CF9|nr:DUF1800 domain-containing protein [Oceanibium sediminis]